MDTVIKAHKIRLNPTKEQEQYFWRCAGVARFAWNWGLAEYNRRKAEGQVVKITNGKEPTLKGEFTTLKKTNCPWLAEVSSYAYQGAFIDLRAAVSRYFDFKKRGELRPPPGYKGRKDGKPFGWPRFKSKDKSTPAFYQANICVRFDGNYVQIQKCPGLVNMAEPLRFVGKVMAARVSYCANHWWISVQVEVPGETPEPNPDIVGVDLGIKYLAVTSDGQVFDNPKPLDAAQRKLARMQRSFARMEKGGQNWHKMKAKIARLHYRVACIRNEASHQMTSHLTGNYGVIALEDLNVKGMTQNHHLARAISDAALYEKRRQLEYKAAWNGGQVVTVGRWFPSSKRCNGCGWIKADLTLSDREWTCENCGDVNHRDGNAAKNIRDEALRILGK